MIGFGYLGGSALGGRRSGLTFRSGLHVSIGDLPVTDFSETGLRITSNLNARGKASLTFIRPVGGALIADGAQLTVDWDEWRVFAGLLEEVDTEPEDLGALWIRCSASDWNALLDRHIVAALFLNMTPKEIVEALVVEQSDLDLDGVRYDEVPDSPVVESLTAQYRKVSDVLKDLTKLIGMDWYVDPFKCIRFFDRASNLAPQAPGDSDRRFANPKLTRSLQDYRNVQILRAGSAMTPARVEYCWGDPPSVTDVDKRKRVWTLKFPVAEEPEIIRNKGTTHAIQRVGIQGVDDEEIPDPDTGLWPQFLWNKDSKEIAQNSTYDEEKNPALGSDEYLTVGYKGFYPITLEAHLHDEIMARQATEGGSGIYMEVLDDDTVEGMDFALDKILGILQRSGYVPSELSFKSYVTGWAAGQIFTSTIASLGIAAEQFLVKTVGYAFWPTKMICSVSSVSGKSQWNWTDYFRKLADAGREFGKKAQDKLYLYRQQEDYVELADAFHDSVNEPAYTLADKWTDPYSWGFVDTISVGGRTMAGLVVGRSKIGEAYVP